ncbi:Lrp/AsnC family transcriptional regulator [Desmospora profundinema]|uniref:Lrp/AsnC family leucine-responsive transcriptional regulator n=1 Tax=Desmospora profundinema TaxID=1571184 RepID=A0ABU1ISD5_9BACL|nr:Lrp/AsnC family transcriptional regulator [Desmospora profundinema]MDR6227358.1 Lrp/AsnC family leucine-responsive transcriptional regulator [Desmospora profundinema]
MDHIDLKILERLQEDARLTFSQLARELHLSHPSVAERVRRLQDKGVIEKFTARVPPQKVNRSVLVIIQVGEIKIPCKEFEKEIQAEPAILECHRVTGSISYFIKAAVPSMSELEKLVDKLTPISRVYTSVVLSSPITSRTLLPLPVEADHKR